MKQRKRFFLPSLCVAALLALSGCASTAESLEPGSTTNPQKTPPSGEKAGLSWPKDKLEIGEDGVPTLAVYVVEQKKASDMDVESYVEAVLAGEMKNDWPLEALKAQAILARTFVLKFVDEKESKYEGANISTDIEEAQAYDASAVNERIKQAVQETAGLVLSEGGKLPYAWFHAHSGGMTALAKEGLGWEKEEPAYTHVTQGNEPEPDKGEGDTLAEAAAWKASFSLSEFAAACKEVGKSIKVNENSQITVGERGKSGRAVTLLCDGQTLDAPALRIALGSTKMRSTMLTSLKVSGDKVILEGKGYGHGVGMSQWGAYHMAEEGKSAEEIVMHYFQNVQVVKLW